MENQLPPPKKGAQPPSPIFGRCLLSKRLYGSRCHLVRKWAQPRPHCVTWGPNSLPKGAQPPIFGRCSLWPNGRPSELLLSTCCLYQWCYNHKVNVIIATTPCPPLFRRHSLCYAHFVSTKVLNVFNEAVKIFEFIHGGPKYHYHCERVSNDVKRCG